MEKRIRRVPKTIPNPLNVQATDKYYYYMIQQPVMFFGPKYDLYAFDIKEMKSDKVVPGVVSLRNFGGQTEVRRVRRRRFLDLQGREKGGRRGEDRRGRLGLRREENRQARYRDEDADEARPHRGVETDPRRGLARGEVPLLRSEPPRRRLERSEEVLRRTSSVREHAARAQPSHDRDGRRAQRLAPGRVGRRLRHRSPAGERRLVRREDRARREDRVPAFREDLPGEQHQSSASARRSTRSSSR